MAEYTIPKPYRDFYVTNPAVETLERVQTLEKDALPNTEVKSGQTIIGTNTLEGKKINIEVRNDNLLSYPYESSQAQLEDGSSLTVNSDGSITAIGTPTDYINLYLKKIIINPSSTYEMGLIGEHTNLVMQASVHNQTGIKLEEKTSGTSGEFISLDMTSFTSPSYIEIRIKRNKNDVPMSGTVVPFVKLADKTETTVYVTGTESYQQLEITCRVGETINVQQYDKYTSIASDNMHVTLSGVFIQDIKHLLNERPIIFVGLFADRPTDTFNYPRIYVATDKTDTDRTTLLQAGLSGATASNWIYM